MMLRSIRSQSLVWLALSTGCVMPDKSAGELDAEGDRLWTHSLETGSRVRLDDLAIDGRGNIALSWHEESPLPAAEMIRSGVRVVDAEGVLLSNLEATDTMFGSIAFDAEGRLLARGATTEGDGAREWVRRYALDGTLEWSHDYGTAGDVVIGAARRDVAVDGSGDIITYRYVCEDEGRCPEGILAKYAPDGALSWETEVGGEGGWEREPLALAPDGSIFCNAIIFHHQSETTEVHKLAPDGTELWTTSVDGLGVGSWSTPAGGLIVSTLDVHDDDKVTITQLDADGQPQFSSFDHTPDYYSYFLNLVALTPTADGFYSTPDRFQHLHRLDLELEPTWSSGFSLGPRARVRPPIGAVAPDGSLVLAWHDEPTANIARFAFD